MTSHFLWADFKRPSSLGLLSFSRAEQAKLTALGWLKSFE